MNSSKKILNKVVESYHEQQLPTDLEKQLQERLEFEKRNRVQRKRRQTVLSLATLLPLLLIGLITFNSQVRAFAAELPLLGPIVQLITGEEYRKKDGDSGVDVKIPKIEEETSAAKSLNEKYLSEGKKDYQEAIKEFGSFKNGNYQVTAEYQKIVDDDRFLVVKRELTRTAADSHTENKYDTIDKHADALLSLPMLFKDDRYLGVLTAEINKQIAVQMEQSENTRYWTQEDVADGTVEKIQLMKPDRNFYINPQHQLVIAFPEYEIAPAYMGTPEFVIPTNVIKDLLVDKNYLE